MNLDEQKKVDILLYSPTLKKRLQIRFLAEKLKVADVVRDANEKGMKTITKEKLSRYFNHDTPIKGFPTQKDILWLCTRWGLEIKLSVTLKNPYSTEESIEQAKQIMEG